MGAGAHQQLVGGSRLSEGQRGRPEEADEIDLDPDSDEADDFAECTSPYA